MESPKEIRVREGGDMEGHLQIAYVLIAELLCLVNLVSHAIKEDVLNVALSWQGNFLILNSII